MNADNNWGTDRRRNKLVIEIDGDRFDDLDGFYEEVSQFVIPGADWGRNLDAFNDILRGGFGTPEGGFIFRWRNSDRSRIALGYPETTRWIESKLLRCHPSWIDTLKNDLKAAQRSQGPTLFDEVVEIIRGHGPGGEQPEDGVELEFA